jgi:hypothetical protein
MQQPVVFECQCGASHRSPDSKVPVGWSTSHGRSWCNDCTAAGVPARASRQRRRA